MNMTIHYKTNNFKTKFAQVSIPVMEGAFTLALTILVHFYIENQSGENAFYLLLHGILFSKLMICLVGH